MLVSSLKRTIGQRGPLNAREETLRGSSSVHKNLLQSDAQVIFNRDDVNSAVGLVVSSLRSARRVLDTFRQAACGSSATHDAGILTLQKQYPFLSDRADRETMSSYAARRQQLLAEGDERGAALLAHSIQKLQGVIQKKQEMRDRFATELQRMSENAQGAELLFSQEEFMEELFGELLEFAQGGEGEGGEEGGKGSRESGEPEQGPQKTQAGADVSPQRAETDPKL